MKAKVARKTSFRRPPDERVADILAAARAVMMEHGYENTVMSDIAKRAGVVEGTLYRFFDNKQELLTRVAEEWLKEQLAGDSTVASIRGTWNKLRHLVWRALIITRQSPALSRFVMTVARPDPNYRHMPLFELNKRFTADIRKLCEEAIASGEFRDDVSPSLLRDMVFGCIEHRTWSYLRGEGDFSIDKVAEGITNVVYRGMAAQASAGDDHLATAVTRIEKAAETLERLQAAAKPARKA